MNRTPKNYVKIIIIKKAKHTIGIPERESVEEIFWFIYPVRN